MLQTFEPDECCGKDLATALLKGGLDKADSWTHLKCGMEWRAETFLDLDRMAASVLIKHWKPFCPTMVIR